MPQWRHACVLLAALTSLFLAIILIRTVTLSTPKCTVHALWERIGLLTPPEMDEDDSEFISTLVQAVTIPTVSHSKDVYNTTAMREFTAFLRKSFPTIFSSNLVTYETVAEYSHLFKVQGLDSQRTPYLLAAHLDVVPALPEGWEFPPFSGALQGGFIYGRGTLDDKQSVVGLLQALEMLLDKGFKPEKTFYIAIGHDEEVGGLDGARSIATLLSKRNISLDFVLDEGSIILEGGIPGLKKPVAIIGVTEKGMLMIKLRVNQKPGHSSMPPRETSIGILSRAVSRIEEQRMPLMFGLGPEKDLLEYLASEFSFPLGIIMSNLWLFSPLVARFLERTPSGNSLVRTTTAVTEFHAGMKSNVLAPVAEATVNFRIHPAQTADEVLELVKHIISDERVNITTISSSEPLPISPIGTDVGYIAITEAIQETFPGMLVAPGICIGATDTKHYKGLTSALYRFNPIWNHPADLPRYHGINERISVKNYHQNIKFYFNLIQIAGQHDFAPVHSHSSEL
uniref:N-fatty-acyl-amino acid synthase/hydrolase PM20D1 n=1 Tax=Myxine glutinosa TaxID=7769 RepID=UPI00358FE059